MPSPLSGPGLGLQLPQNLYPSELTNAPYDYGTNRLALPGGTEIPVPAGTWYINLGFYLFAEYFDQPTGTWIIAAAGSQQVGAPFYVKSDGFNWRISNRLACPMGAIVTASGGSYVQATTTVAVTAGNGALFSPVVGGAYSVSSIVGTGAGYGVPPLVIIPAPPPASNNANGVGGRPATAYAVLGSNGSVSTVSIVDQGCGYPTGVTVVLLPNPTDPNLATGITLATIAFSTVFAGSITGILNTNPGGPVATPNQMSISVSGAGAGATVAPVMLTTLTTASVTTGGLGFGTTLTSVGLTTAGGNWPPGGLTNTAEKNNIFARARPAQALLNVTGATGSISTQNATIIDGGLFFIQGNNASVAGQLNPALTLGTSVGTAGSITGPVIALTVGGSNTFDIAFMQPAP